MEVNIAICDDDENSLELIEKEIKNAAKTLEEQLNIFPYTYGKQLLEMLEKENDIYDILLLDIDMPDISGLDIAKYINNMDKIWKELIEKRKKCLRRTSSYKEMSTNYGKSSQNTEH